MRIAQIGGEYDLYQACTISSIVEDSPGYYTVTGDFSTAGYTAYLTSIEAKGDNKQIIGIITAKSDSELSVMGYARTSDGSYCYIYVAKGHASNCWTILKNTAITDPLIDAADVYCFTYAVTYPSVNFDVYKSLIDNCEFRVFSYSRTGLDDSENNALAANNVNSSSGFVIAHSCDEHCYINDVLSTCGSTCLGQTGPMQLDLISATGAGNSSGNAASYGPGLEYYSTNSTAESYSTPYIAASIAKLLVNNPNWTFDDARQALRQTATNWNTGWSIDLIPPGTYDNGGFGAIDYTLASDTSSYTLGVMSPIVITEYNYDKNFFFEWRNYRQSEFSQSLISIFYTEPNSSSLPQDGIVIYSGSGTSSNYVDTSENTEAWVVFYSQNNSGSYSRPESYDINYYPSMSVFSGGSGTELDPYQIDNITQLQYLNNIEDYHFYHELIGDVDATNTATWNDGIGFQSIFIDSYPDYWPGELEGNNHIIDGLFMSASTVSGWYYLGGLFSKIENNISNLHLTNLIISSSIGNVGGLIGFNAGNLTNCSVEVSMSLYGDNTNVGGLVYYNSGTVKKCYTHVDIVSNQDVQTRFHAGGLIGVNVGNVENCYSTGIITSSFVTSDVSSSGLIYLCGYITEPKYVIDCYSAVIANNIGTYFGMVNALYPEQEELWTTSSCYYDKTIINNTSSSVFGEPKTTAEMKTQETYINWNFNAVWNINNDYPTLLGTSYSGSLGYLIIADGNYNIIMSSSLNSLILHRL